MGFICWDITSCISIERELCIIVCKLFDFRQSISTLTSSGCACQRESILDRKMNSVVAVILLIQIETVPLKCIPSVILYYALMLSR